MKNKILPIIAGVLVIVAILVVIFIPKNSKEDKSANVESGSSQSTTNTTTNPTKNTTIKSTSKLATLDEEGNVIINKSDVSEDKISFLKYSEDSKIELIAIKGENGDVNVALGTCGSCNGSPFALLAPTAVNEQKFKFELIEENKVKATAPNGRMTKIDLGIVKYHFELGANEQNFSWTE